MGWHRSSPRWLKSESGTRLASDSLHPPQQVGTIVWCTCSLWAVLNCECLSEYYRVYLLLDLYLSAFWRNRVVPHIYPDLEGSREPVYYKLLMDFREKLEWDDLFTYCIFLNNIFGNRQKSTVFKNRSRKSFKLWRNLFSKMVKLIFKTDSAQKSLPAYKNKVGVFIVWSQKKNEAEENLES